MNLPLKLSPYLKYAGRKFNHPAPLSALFAPYRKTHTWVEPFAGANGATFEVLPKTALLNDRNPYAIALHQWIKTVGVPTDTSYLINEREQYHLNRTWFNKLVKEYPTCEGIQGADPVDREAIALLYYYLNRTGFNGLMRFNKKRGEFNTPFGKNAGVYQPDFLDYQAVMQDWSFYCADWDNFLGYAIDFLGENAWIYADPPFDGTSSAFVGYTGGSFGWEEQVELCDRLSQLSVPVVASNLATERILELYRDRGFWCWTFPVRRSVSGKAKGRVAAIELLAIKGMNEAECGVMSAIDGVERFC